MGEYLLCIESSTEICSVAVFEGDNMLCLKEEKKTNKHAEILVSLVQDCVHASNISLHDIAAVAVSLGPGSYTSLRVGLSTAKGICYALKKPLIGIPSDLILLEGNKDLAMQSGCSDVIAMIDARRMEAYCTSYHIDTGETSPCLPVIFDETSFWNVKEKASKIGLCGNGAEKYYEISNKKQCYLLSKETSAGFMGPIAVYRFRNQIFDDVAYTIPVYIKDPNITVSKKNLWSLGT